MTQPTIMVCKACCYPTVRLANDEQDQPEYMLKVSMQVSSLELDLDQQVDEELGPTLQGPPKPSMKP